MKELKETPEKQIASVITALLLYVYTITIMILGIECSMILRRLRVRGLSIVGSLKQQMSMAAEWY